MRKPIDLLEPGRLELAPCLPRLTPDQLGLRGFDKGFGSRAEGARPRRLAVKLDQHARTPPKMFHTTDLAMKHADRRGEM